MYWRPRLLEETPDIVGPAFLGRHRVYLALGNAEFSGQCGALGDDPALNIGNGQMHPHEMALILVT
jgi:hypothetical protein